MLGAIKQGSRLTAAVLPKFAADGCAAFLWSYLHMYVFVAVALQWLFYKEAYEII